MVVLKKANKSKSTLTTQSTPPVGQHTATIGASSSMQTERVVDNAPHVTLRYSDIAAGRESTRKGTPIRKLIHIFELCEQVLEYLSMKDLLRVTRVCRAFRPIIANSPRLQAKLFLAPDCRIKKLAISPHGTLVSGIKAERQVASLESSADASEGTGDIKLYTPHPALKVDRIADRFKWMGIVRYAIIRAGKPASFLGDANLSIRRSIAARRFESTWVLRKMLISQPPIEKVRVFFSINSGWNPREVLRKHVTICNKTGITFGDITTALLAAFPVETVQLTSVSIEADGAHFFANRRARDVAEKAGELSVDDDPTQWITRDGPLYDHMLQDGGFSFVCREGDEE